MDDLQSLAPGAGMWIIESKALLCFHFWELSLNTPESTFVDDTPADYPEPLAFPHLASQVLKRSFISSPWSLHHSQSLRRARLEFCGLVGMCRIMSTPFSAWVEINGTADLRVGL